MSLTARDCSKCGYSVFADDDHSCIMEGRAVCHPEQLPEEPHWAILEYHLDRPKKASAGSVYRAYLSEKSWKDKVLELTAEKALFSAFKASAPAKISTEISVKISVND